MGINRDKLATKLDALIRQLQDLAEELRGDVVALSPRQLAKITDYGARRICLKCGLPLGDESVRRGCHHTCYNTLQQQIGRGELTRAEAIEAVMYNPIRQRPGRKPRREQVVQNPAKQKQTALEVGREYAADGRPASSRKKLPKGRGSASKKVPQTEGE